ncbi:hypothetical protein [Microvirga flavescens]|uniref:hypothetical protein n=1 Tax=Microvirga flavescens TaxID=2249811 RepID=UPI0013006586|nr:hypothetical protein [Microvirga flavescens]
MKESIGDPSVKCPERTVHYMVRSAFEAGRSSFERRILNVLAHPQVVGLEGSAVRLALTSPDLSPDQVVAFVTGHIQPTLIRSPWEAGTLPN